MNAVIDNENDHLQFRLIWLIVAMIAVGIGCVLWNLDPPGPAILVMIVAIFVIPGCCLVAAIRLGGARRALLWGMFIPQAALLVHAGFNMETLIPLDSDGFSKFLSESRESNASVQDLQMRLMRRITNPRSWLPQAQDYHRYVMSVFVLSIVSGLLSAIIWQLLTPRTANTTRPSSDDVQPNEGDPDHVT